MIVTIRHLRSIPYFRPKPGFCLKKARVRFREHGLDFKAFVRDGIDETTLLATGDGMAEALVRWAHESEGQNGQ